ncbi:ComEC/Rec2 family competence protein [Bartonella krasnovii]|uniref:ComEC/Rec2 family competence protein n=1 Tax=Bartonella krasnovii TaxID=2267275 RepID=UPI001F4C8201|nr:ComEC/Rec2 family competence protein [Bartonella krasnovii]UNF37659.1 ComEC family competence protein [Bartonella krasnovii]UNF39443.1 ComEC family competence protein [Bartonella krasnovii]UNF44453.1 ComEC family competence protein [Bartonella krasnovii]UNF45983.1 ComEC family competence protein [Bartonella krasnovii]UNF50988.1 ComEC family competence protein [Bartonella krasnovii]
MFNQSKIKEGLSAKSVIERKNAYQIGQGVFSSCNDAKNGSYKQQKPLLLTLLKKAIIVIRKWLADCIEKEVSFGILFSLILVFFSLGIIFYFHLELEPSWRQLGVLISIFGGIFYIAHFYRKIWIPTGLLFCFALGVLAAKIETWRIATPMLSSDVVTTLTGRIISVESVPKRGFRLVLDVLSTEKPILHHSLHRVRVSARYLPSGLAIGDGLYGRVKIRAFSGAVRPGGYDFSFHNYFKGIGAQGIYLGKPIKISVSPPDGIFAIILQKIENLRMKMTQRIRLALEGEKGSVAVALITGQRAGISNETNEALRTAGLAHILSISGLHMALLSGLVLLSIRSFLSFFPVFSSYYSNKKFAAIVAFMITAFYLFLSGLAISAQRSFVMIAVMLVAILCNRSAITMRNFSIAGLITLAIRPHEILGPSFQMSFSATAALIAFFDWWSRRSLFRTRKTISSYVGERVINFAFLSIFSTCASSFVAGSASGIYAAYHFSNMASLSIISNAFALPIISILVIPFGLIAVLAMLGGFEWLPLQIMGFGVDLVIKIAHAIKTISPDLNPGFMPLSALVLLSIGLVGLTFCKTPIRLFFSLFILAGISICIMHSPVQLIIADNMRLVGVIHDKKLYIDRYHHSKFTTTIWKKSFRLNETIKPTKYGPSFHGQFICDHYVCTSLLENGLKVIVLRERIDHCIEADILIQTFIMHNPTCHKKAKIIFTPQQLLLRGSVMMTKGGDIIWSSLGVYRPWNMHRKYSQKNI